MASPSKAYSDLGYGLKLAALLVSAALLAQLVALWLGGPADALRSTLLAVLLSAALGWVLGQALDRRAAERLRRQRRALRRLGMGDFNIALDSALRDSLDFELEQAAANLLNLRQRQDDLAAAKEAEAARLRGEVARLAQENMRLQSESLQRGKSVASLQEFVVSINRMGDPAQIAGQLLNFLDSEVEYSIATVMLVDPDTQQLAPVAVSNREKGTRLVGKYMKDIQSLQPLGAKSAIGRVMEAGKPLIIGDVVGDRRGLSTRAEIRSEIGVPLKVQEKVVGVLHLESARPEAYGQDQEALLALLANATATAIGNIRLFEEERKVRVLREMDRVKSQLISTVSHELRTPLAAIKGYSTSLQRPQGKIDERTRHEFLEIIEEETDRLSEMIENLLDMSKIEAGVLRLHKQPVQIERIVRKVVDQAKRRGGDFRFRARFPLDLPSVPVAPHRIEQVLRNLVENAVKYSPNGGRITVSGEVDGDRLVVSVADEGMGIPGEHIDRVFEPFYQVDGSTTRRVGGSGLGLAICRGFVEAHGGEIWVESEPDRGSTFRFSLPLEDGDDVTVDAAVEQVVG